MPYSKVGLGSTLTKIRCNLSMVTAVVSVQQNNKDTRKNFGYKSMPIMSNHCIEQCLKNGKLSLTYFSNKGSSTDLADIGLFSSMDSHVLLQVAFLHE